MNFYQITTDMLPNFKQDKSNYIISYLCIVVAFYLSGIRPIWVVFVSAAILLPISFWGLVLIVRIIQFFIYLFHENFRK